MYFDEFNGANGPDPLLDEDSKCRACGKLTEQHRHRPSTNNRNGWIILGAAVATLMFVTLINR